MEAEWEYAAGAGTTKAFYAGEAVSRELEECVLEPNLERAGWYCANSGGRAHATAQKEPNAWGLYDVQTAAGAATATAAAASRTQNADGLDLSSGSAA